MNIYRIPGTESILFIDDKLQISDSKDNISNTIIKDELTYTDSISLKLFDVVLTLNLTFLWCISKYQISSLDELYNVKFIQHYGNDKNSFPFTMFYKKPMVFDTIDDVVYRLVPGYPHLAVSANGKCISTVTKEYIKPKIKGRTPRLYTFSLHRSSVSRVRVARLVALAWVPILNFNKCSHLIFKDGNKLNCYYKNIEWTSFYISDCESIDTADIVRRRKLLNGYVLIWAPEHYSSYKTNAYRHWIYEHIYLMELKIGRKLTSDENVHHIDGNRSNNDYSNLLLLTRIEHSCLHNPSNVVYSNRCKNCNNLIRSDFHFCNDHCYREHLNKNRILNGVDKEELSKLLQTSPVTKVAEQFNMSDNGLRKYCKRENIKIPKREKGFWAKVKVGLIPEPQ